jgi:hypothetical protein
LSARKCRIPKIRCPALLCAVPDGQPLDAAGCCELPERASRAPDPDHRRIEIPMTTSPQFLPVPTSATPTRPMARALRIAIAAATCGLAATLAYPAPASPVEHVGINAERGDPARWYVPADTPQLKYEAQVMEARAALGEELKECRALQSGRNTCVAQANAQHRRDVEDARSLLSQSRGGAVRDR